MDLEKKLIVSDEKKDNNKVYIVENGKKRWIMSPKSFENLGYLWENIEKIPASIINKIREGDPIGDSAYDIRSRMAAPFLSGRGIEIGAGINPMHLPEEVECVYFDKRDENQITEYFKEASTIKTYPLSQFSSHFPELADFLIAHNVLEHCSNPVSTLIEWHGMIKNTGFVILSVPCREHCPDKGRNLSPFDHILLDYLFERTDDSFESREHIYSFIMGWIDDGGFKNKNKFEVAESAHQCAQEKENDLHWHVFSEDVLKKCIQFSAQIKGMSVCFDKIAAPYKTDSNNMTECEIIIIYHLITQKPGLLDESLNKEILQMKKKLEEANQKISEVLIPNENNSRHLAKNLIE